MRNMFQEAMKKAEDEGAKVTRIIDVGQSSFDGFGIIPSGSGKSFLTNYIFEQNTRKEAIKNANCTQSKDMIIGEDRIYGIKPKVILHSLKKQEQYLNCLYRNQSFCDFNDSVFKSFLVEPNTKVYILEE